MKSFFCVAAFIVLPFFFTVPVYSRGQAEDQPAVSIIDSSATIDSAKFGILSPAKKSFTQNDSVKLKADTSRIVRADSTVKDSVRIRFIPGMGQLIHNVDTTSRMHHAQLLWDDARDVGDLIWKLPGFFYRDLGETGKWGELNAFGTDGRGIGILFDGRPMNDPVTGTYNSSDLPLELIDHPEILSGSSSFGAPKGSGTALNFVTRSYNSFRPMTKLRFVSSPKGTILTDGMFTQNVARGLNLMIGFQRLVTVGRYTNASLDGWNVRTRLRYNVSDRFNVALTDFYTKAVNGLNGGVDLSQSTTLLEDGGAIVVSQTAWDSRSRRDVTLSSIARLLADSSSTTQANFYYSTLEREYRNPPYIALQNPTYQNIHDSTKASFWGMRFQQSLALHPANFTFGGYWERRQSDSTRILPAHLESERSLFVQTEFLFIKQFVPSFSLRSTSLDDESSLSTGFSVKSAVTDWLTLFVDASWFDRFPTIQERYWKDTTFIRTGNISKEQHEFIQGGLSANTGSHLQLTLTGFQRNVKNAIAYQPDTTRYGSTAIALSNVNNVKIVGVNGQAVLHWGKFEALGVMTLTHYTQNDTVKLLTPDIILSGEICYRDTAFFKYYNVKIGFRSRFFNKQNGMQFDPQTLSYVEYRPEFLVRTTTFDLFAVLKIGDAYVSVSWVNFLNAQYLLAPVYPMAGRHVQLGVHWVFLD